MVIKYKQYPYPVLAEDTDDYSASKFTSSAGAALDGYNIKFTLSAETDNKELQLLIKQGKAVYTHHIECPQTCFRTAVNCDSSLFEYIISDSKLNGLVQVCTFITAAEDIPAYSNKDFNPDYRGFRFNIDKGCIIAVGSQSNIRIDKERDDVANTSSIFCIIQNSDKNVQLIKVDTGKQKIVVILPETAYYRYKNMKSMPNLQPAMHSMIIVPSLMHVIDELKRECGNLFMYEDYRWFRSLRKTAKRFGVEFTEEGFNRINSFEFAQQLLNTPLLKSLEFLSLGDEEDAV